VLLSSAGPAAAGPEDELLSLLLRAENVQATGIGPTSIFVSWTDRSPVDTNYRIEIASDEAGPYTEVATHQCAVPVGPTAMRLPQVDVTCATQFQTGPASSPLPIFVRVVPLIAVSGVTILEGVPSEADPALLGAVPPTNLRCNGGGDTACLHVNSVTLTWTDNSDEAEFWVMRARGAVNPNFGTAPHAVVPANTTSFSEFLTEFSTTFFYRVVAVRRQNIPRLDSSVTVEQSFSNSLATGGLLDRVKVETAPVPPPTDPSGLTAVFIAPSTARLTWTDQEFNLTSPYVDEDGWFIDFGPSATDFRFTTTPLPFPGQGSVVYEDDNIPPDTTRCFRVRGWRNGPALSGFTNVACIGSIPKKPTGLDAIALDNATVKVVWEDNSTAETHFSIERCNGICTHAGSWIEVGQVPADTEMFLDTGTFGNTTYSYRVKAMNNSGTSPASNIDTVTTPVSPVIRPTDLTAQGTGSHEITLEWLDHAPDETGFRIEYKDPDGFWRKLDERGPRLGTGLTTYVDTISLAANETRCYRVRALKVMKLSDPSNEACATTLPPAVPNGKPTDVTGLATSNVEIDLSWKDNATNEDFFRIEVVTFNNLDCPQNATGKPWVALTTAPKHPATGTTNLAIQNLLPHTAYVFRVIAVNKDGESDPSDETICLQTKGPPLPVFVDPAASGDIEATRCDVEIKTPFNHGGGPLDPDYVDRVKLLVNAWVPETGVGHTDTVWIESPKPASVTSTHAIWRGEYKFRKGVTYRLIAQSFGDPPTRYFSQQAQIRDVKVLADCPLDI
jgi:hypothetical protein